MARDPKTINLRHAYEAVANDPEILSRHPEREGRVEGALADFMNTVMGDAEAALLAELEAVSIAEMNVHVRTALGLPALKPRP